MTQVQTRPEAPAPPAQWSTRRRGWRLILHWFGVLCLMAATAFGGYVVWLLWGTGLSTQRAQNELRTNFEQVVDTQDPSQAPERIPLGEAYAQLLIPSVGINFMVVEGTEYEDLKDGPGHYADTADPWQDTGRVGIAGHRTTYLHPFFNLDKVQPGDRITLRTKFGSFDYVVDRVFEVPELGSGKVLAKTEVPTLVLTTCHPKYLSYERLIVTATREQT
jgi:LPXTG-site transpeptidase (sortase) family protein